MRAYRNVRRNPAPARAVFIVAALLLGLVEARAEACTTDKGNPGFRMPNTNKCAELFGETCRLKGGALGMRDPQTKKCIETHFLGQGGVCQTGCTFSRESMECECGRT